MLAAEEEEKLIILPMLFTIDTADETNTDNALLIVLTIDAAEVLVTDNDLTNAFIVAIVAALVEVMAKALNNDSLRDKLITELLAYVMPLPTLFKTDVVDKTNTDNALLTNLIIDAVEVLATDNVLSNAFIVAIVAVLVEVTTKDLNNDNLRAKLTTELLAYEMPLPTLLTMAEALVERYVNACVNTLLSAPFSTILSIGLPFKAIN